MDPNRSQLEEAYWRRAAGFATAGHRELEYHLRQFLDAAWNIKCLARTIQLKGGRRAACVIETTVFAMIKPPLQGIRRVMQDQSTNAMPSEILEACRAVEFFTDLVSRGKEPLSDESAQNGFIGCFLIALLMRQTMNSVRYAFSDAEAYDKTIYPLDDADKALAYELDVRIFESSVPFRRQLKRLAEWMHTLAC